MGNNSEEKRIIDSGTLKARVSEVLSEFYWVNNFNYSLTDNPFTITAEIDPRAASYEEIVNLVEFVGDDEDSAKARIGATGLITSLKEAYDNGKEFYYLMGIDEVKMLLSKSYGLPKNKFLSDIIKIRGELNIIIKDKDAVLIGTP